LLAVAVVLVIIAVGFYWLYPTGSLRPMLRRAGRRLGLGPRGGLALLVAFVGPPLVGYLLAPADVTVDGLAAALALGGYGGGLLVLGGAAGNRSLYRRLDSADPYATPAPGPVVVAGETRCDDPDAAPFTAEPAVCWVARAEVKETTYGHGFRRRSFWATIESGSGGVPFTVDGTRIDPDGARILPFGPLPGAKRAEPETFVDEYLPDRVRSGLARLRGVDVEAVENHAGDEGARFRAATLAPGETVTVVGELERVPAGEYEDTYVVRDGDPFAVLVGGLESTRAELRKAVVRNGAIGLALLATTSVAGLFVLELL
jgi:hypothetical protein